jgi:hypothetical protein
MYQTRSSAFAEVVLMKVMKIARDTADSGVWSPFAAAVAIVVEFL